ncbi:MAG: hypothetical protein MUE50_14175 [Pirellulaceae bacterium]|nr:hypothetical protein [Pirellulaceae bacterium]
MKSLFPTITFCLACLAGWASAAAQAQDTLTLENGRLGLNFDQRTGTLTAIHNKLTGETYAVSGDEFAVEAVEFGIEFGKLKLAAMKQSGGTLDARYETDGMTVEVTYCLRGENHFAEKHITLTSTRNYGLKKVVLSRPTFALEVGRSRIRENSGVFRDDQRPPQPPNSHEFGYSPSESATSKTFAAGVQIVPYRYPKYGRAPGQEPTCTFFGRTPKGGLFTGTEVPFDASTASGQQLTLGYAPSLKVAGGEKLACEPVYFGVYRRSPADKEEQDLPLQSEADAMVAMTSAILGPPRFGLVPMACGWHSEMTTGTYTEASVQEDMQALDFLAACGIDWLSDSHPWAGETQKMNALGPNDKYQPGPLEQKFLEHSRKVDVKIVMWSSMNKTHAWSGLGRPFRPDQPDWLLDAGAKPPEKAPDWRKKTSGVLSSGGNCFAVRPFFDWLVRINLEGLAAGQYKAWAMDGDFFGGGGWYTTVVPVDCQSDKHDHLPGDSNYACQRALAQLTAAVRQSFPQTYVFMCRPPMDLGIWSLRNVDVCFTLLESGTGKDNLAAGDLIRNWSRVRVHRDFFPHYLDQPLLFPSRAGAAGRPGNWPSGHLDYILLSALSSSPNQLYYMPTKTGIPEADKAEIRKWLDWGRKNIAYLKVRKDLPDWPAPGKVDGSAHIVGDRGLVFLFNPNKTPLHGEFALTEESVGLEGGGSFSIAQEYPAPGRTQTARAGETIRWEVPAQTAVILRIQSAAR